MWRQLPVELLEILIASLAQAFARALLLVLNARLASTEHQRVGTSPCPPLPPLAVLKQAWHLDPG